MGFPTPPLSLLEVLRRSTAGKGTRRQALSYNSRRKAPLQIPPCTTPSLTNLSRRRGSFLRSCRRFPFLEVGLRLVGKLSHRLLPFPDPACTPARPRTSHRSSAPARLHARTHSAPSRPQSRTSALTPARTPRSPACTRPRSLRVLPPARPRTRPRSLRALTPAPVRAPARPRALRSRGYSSRAESPRVLPPPRTVRNHHEVRVFSVSAPKLSVGLGLHSVARAAPRPFQGLSPRRPAAGVGFRAPPRAPSPPALPSARPPFLSRDWGCQSAGSDAARHRVPLRGHCHGHIPITRGGLPEPPWAGLGGWCKPPEQKQMRFSLCGGVGGCEISKDPLKAILLELECHFTWNLLKEDILFDVDDTIEQQLEFLTTEPRLTLYNQLAYVKHLKGQNKDALAYLEQAEDMIQREHQDKEEIRCLVTWGNYAWVYYHMDQLKEAQRHLDKIGAVCKKLSSPSDYKLESPEIECEKGWAFLKFGGKYYQKAKVAFEKALEAQPDNPEFSIGYAITVYRLDDCDREGPTRSLSLGPLRKAVTLNPDNAYIKVLLALKLQDVHAEAEGERYIEEILNQISSQPYILRYAAKFYRRKKSWDKALGLLQKGLKVTPRSSFLHHQMGLCYRGQMIQIKKGMCNRPKEEDKLRVDRLIAMALSHFKAAVERDSTFVFAYTDLANMYAEGGQCSDAEEVFQRVLHRENITDDHRHQIHYYYGRFQEFHCKSESTAIHHYLEALKVRDRSSLRTKLTSALKRLAVKRLSQDASDVQSLHALGFVYKLEGEKRQAAEYYAQAQRMDPENAESLAALCELQLSI
ncbi:LOW QUALITY PROTEIN: interferon-induced protein with tetratricopeptide repeats 5-like [Hyaena hyaena]|uniref:LOW QUALITY PROTEIN: interferon-induced protein with tetratricopeptide repeats 5-like n=1 Tax=Hyaena hyaena TaxID=95912 RepID=UPI001924C9F8|nr:LOW QUALITY PROTEIN: interferon-induced protein with tetratricopeptide repeats 5-like [Hyaena hyaena]